MHVFAGTSRYYKSIQNYFFRNLHEKLSQFRSPRVKIRYVFAALVARREELIFIKNQFFSKNLPKPIWAFWALHIKTTAGTSDLRMGSNPLTRKCGQVLSEPCKELKARRERENDPADMWHILKN